MYTFNASCFSKKPFIFYKKPGALDEDEKLAQQSLCYVIQSLYHAYKQA
ncbi:MAG TPA: hypothetical protein VH540_14295 [Ktedonobacterales bacterium]